MPFRRSIHVIFNPHAGARRRQLLDRVVAQLKATGAEVVLEETKAAGHAIELARAAARAGVADVIVAAGGDGTINEVARGLLGQGVPLGIVPLGTANVLAAEIGLKRDVVEIVDMLLSGPAQLIGTGLVEGRIFLLMVGIGFDGEVVHNINPVQKRRWSKLAFLYEGMKLWWRGPGHAISLKVDGREKSASWVVAMNGKRFAGDFLLSPDGDISQPGLTLFLFKTGTRVALARYMIALAMGRVAELRDVEILPMREAIITSPDGLAVEVDGDARGGLPQTIAQGTQFLRLVVPSIAS